MSKKTIWLTKETRKGLKKIDNYLKSTLIWVRYGYSIEVKRMITDIEDRGYYF